MTIVKINGATITPEQNNLRRRKLGALLSSDPITTQDTDYDDFNTHRRCSRRSTDAASTATPPPTTATTFYSNPSSAASSPYNNTAMSPWSQSSPYTKSPWIHQPAELSNDDESGKNSSHKDGLIGSLFREEGHVYSIAAAGNLLYTGSDSKNIRVWKNFQEFSGFKSSSGLLKAIVVFQNKVFTGHQDGKIRVWRFSGDRKNSHKRVGSLPTTRDLLMKSMNPKNYIEVRRHHNVPWVKHYDAVSCLSIDEDQGLLYSGSWDKTLKVWRISDSKCLESIYAHDDALNSVVVFHGFVFTGSADGTVKAWRRELVGRSTQHVLVETLLKQDHAITSLVVSRSEEPAVYAGSSDGLVSFWEREKHFMTFGGVLRGHKMAVLCLAAAGNLVMSGSADKSICVWRRDVGGEHACVAVLTGHDGPVKCLAVDDNNEDEDDDDDDDVEDEESGNREWILYSGSLDKSVKVWRVSDHAESAKELQEE